VSHTLTYPATTVDDVYAMLADPDYRRAVAEKQRTTDFSCDVTPAGSGMRVRLEVAHATDRMPSFARRLVGSELRFVQEESWASHSAADIQVTIPGKPGEMAGTTTLTRAGGDVVERIELTVKVAIPLVGGKAEDLVAGFLGKAYDAEHAVGTAWLRGEGRH
jgi:Protein of unknown function (DUF2505)